MPDIDRDSIASAAITIRNGGVVVYPTETVYGIGCDPMDTTAIRRIHEIKRRDASKTLLLLADTFERVELFTGPLGELVARLAEIFWPGPLTMVIKPAQELPDHLYGMSGGIAFRVTPHPTAVALINEFGLPITSTSANISHEKPIVTYEDALNKFGRSADVVLPNYQPLQGKPSTVIDLTTGKVVLIREGTVSLERIREVL